MRSRRQESESERSDRIYVDLLHIAAGRADLSRNPVDHDDWCARTLDPEATCTCTRSPLFNKDAR